MDRSTQSTSFALFNELDTQRERMAIAAHIIQRRSQLTFTDFSMNRKYRSAIWSVSSAGRSLFPISRS